MSQVVNVVVPRPLWQTYDYVIPDNLSHTNIEVGARVRVPFGPTSTIALVIGIAKESKHSGSLRSVSSVLDSQSIITDDLLKLMHWLSSYYHCALGTVLETMLPTEVLRGRPMLSEPDYLWSAVPQQETVQFSRAIRQQEVWELLTQRGSLTDAELRVENVVRSVLHAMERKGLVQRKSDIPQYQFNAQGITPLPEQADAIQSIVAGLNQFGVHVLDGVTGSGKTEVYIRVIKEVLKQGRQVLILVPEIALTPQTANHFKERFGSVAVLHSMRTNLQRFDIWCRVARGEQRLVLGTRSAIFTPFQNLGLIVIDEEHDASYKQGDSLRYSARDSAIVRAKELDIPIVLGSATLSLETAENIKRDKFASYKLSARPGVAKLPKFQLLDIRGQKLQGGMSPQLFDIMRRHLDQDGQVLVLINRRGYAPSLLCYDCGWRARCRECEVYLTLHEFPMRELRCHHCERHYSFPSHCPDCNGTKLGPVGAATQKVVETLGLVFNNIRIRRIDRDAVNTNRKLDQTFAEMHRPGRGILVGTQMLAKGHHLPNVTLVAVLRADAGFFSSDFRAAERTAQLIVQVAGRAGRAEREGEVWIQTYDTQHPHLESLATSGYSGFLRAELTSRKLARLPPYAHIAVLRADGTNSDEVQSFLHHLLDLVSTSGTEKLGPAPAPIPRINNRWRCQAVLLDSDRGRLHQALTLIEKISVPRSRVRWSIDVDPMDMS